MVEIEQNNNDWYDIRTILGINQTFIRGHIQFVHLSCLLCSIMSNNTIVDALYKLLGKRFRLTFKTMLKVVMQYYKSSAHHVYQFHFCANGDELNNC